MIGAKSRTGRSRIGRSGIDRTWIAMAAFAALAVFGVLARPLLPIDETRYLAVAWEMRTGGHWLVPQLNGAAYSHKPPLLFWLINLVWSVTGVSETAARLVGPAFGVAAIWATSRLASRLWPEDPEVGGRAAMTLAGLGAFTLFAGLAMFDAMLTFAVVAGVWAIAWAGGGQGGGDDQEDARLSGNPGDGRDLRDPGRQVRGGREHRSGRGGLLGWVGLGAALALGGLAKGPVILVHLAPLALGAPLWAGIPPRRALAGFALALGIGLGLTGLWLGPALALGGPDYRQAVLWTQSAGRMTESFAHARPWWFFLALLPVLLWPFGWSAGIWRRIAALDPRAEPGLRLAALWAGSALLLFSLMSGKQTHYLLPALPAAALVLARAMRDAPAAPPVAARPVAAPLAALPLAALGLACLAAALGLAPAELRPLLQPPALLALLGLGFLELALVGGLRLRGADLAWLAFGAVALANLAFLLGAPGRAYDTAPIAELVAPSDAAGVGVLGRAYQGEFTFAARLQNPVALVSPREAEAWLAADPGRALVARLDREHPSWPPRASAFLRNHLTGVWGGPPADREGADHVALD